MGKYALLAYFIFSLSISTSAQQLERNYISIAPSYGRMLNFDDPDKFEDQIPGIDIAFSQSMFQNKSEWIDKLNVKYQQTAFTYMNQRALDGMLDSSKNAIGDVYMLTHSLLIGMMNKGNNAIYFIPGFGFAYDTKTFYDDFRNIFIGTHFNYAIRLEFQYQNHINERNILSLGLKYMHYSNGAFILPNRGINSLSVKLGYAFKL